MYILYKTDFNHSYKSRDIIGIFTNKAKLLKESNKIITEDLKEDSGQLSFQEEKQQIIWHKQFFAEKLQTQGLNNFELQAEEVQSNIIF